MNCCDSVTCSAASTTSDFIVSNCAFRPRKRMDCVEAVAAGGDAPCKLSRLVPYGCLTAIMTERTWIFKVTYRRILLVAYHGVLHGPRYAGGTRGRRKTGPRVGNLRRF
jgi:hypothetical protein